jgi:hypothetical protein
MTNALSKSKELGKYFMGVHLRLHGKGSVVHPVVSQKICTQVLPSLDATLEKKNMCI